MLNRFSLPPPKDGDCFIVFDTDDDVLADNPSSKKAYANGSWGDAGGGGGGTSFPTFTKTGTNSWTCDMTFEEAKAVWDAESLGTRIKVCPCLFNSGLLKVWNDMGYFLRSDIESETQPPMPSDLIGCLAVDQVFYGNDNNFYIVESE